MSENTDKIILFEQTPIPKAVVKLAVPTILSSLVMVLYNLADTYFVGMCNDPIQNAAVTLAAPVLLAFNAVTNLFGIGSSSMMSRALGRKDYDTVYKSSALGFYCAAVSGVLFALACLVFNIPLLRMLGANADTMAATGEYLKWTAIYGAVPAILNVVMAYMVRAEGAGLATFLSNCVACLYFFVLLYKKKKSTFVCVNPKRLSMDRKIIYGICAVGIPASIQNLLNVTGMTILNNFTSSFGADAVAAMGITQKINMVPMNIAMGISQGIMPLISYTYSSGNHKRMKGTLVFAARASLGFITVVAAFYYLSSAQLTEMFMSNEAIISYGTKFLRGFCLGLPFLCMDFLAVGVFQSVGMGKEALIFAIMRKIILEIPALYILNYLFPLYGLAYAQFVAEIVLAAAAVIVLAKLFKKIEKQKVIAR